jgi:hypothetical protein
MKVHGSAPSIVTKAFENDPAAPDGRKKLFAMFLDPSAYYYCRAWSGKIVSVKPTWDGWEVDLTVMPHLKSRGGVPYNTSKTLETWRVSKLGGAHCVKCDGVPGMFGVD